MIQRCSPLTLTHVCRHWREASMGLRPLWCLIRIKEHTPLSQVQCYIDRSVDHLLDIVIEDVHPDRVQAVYNELHPHANRWRSFRLVTGSIGYEGPEDWHMAPFLKAGDNLKTGPLLVAPKLAVMDLRKRFDVITWEDDVMNYPCFSSSMLRKLTVVNANFDWRHLGLHTNLSMITELNIDQGPHGADILQVKYAISQMASLESLRVKIVHLSSEIAVEAVSCTMPLPNLKTLALRILAPGLFFWSWMINLKAPQLAHLYLEHHPEPHDIDDQWQGEDIQNRMETLRRAVRFPSLIKFHCQPTRVPRRGPKSLDLAAFMILIPSISMLTLDSWTGLDPILSLFHFDCTFPRLKQITFRGFFLFELPPEDNAKLTKAARRLNPRVSILTQKQFE
ncbi:hypothetical protein FRC02_003422 [Tulasnella sp. 418]|nr:hypothetical protein FRC02_003422 [Tulasnella sp. 418]